MDTAAILPVVAGVRPLVSYHPLMGFNPFRPQNKTAFDVTLVIVFVLLALAVVAWGFFG